MSYLTIVSLALLGLTYCSGFSVPQEIPGFTYLGPSGSPGSGAFSRPVNCVGSGSYFVSNARVTWDIAYSSCSSLGAGSHLLTLEDVSEDAKVREYMQRGDGIDKVWTSGLAHNGVWKWATTGALISYPFAINWLGGTPAPTTGLYISIERGVTILDDGWRAVPKSTTLRYICETPSDCSVPLF